MKIIIDVEFNNGAQQGSFEYISKVILSALEKEVKGHSLKAVTEISIASDIYSEKVDISLPRMC